MAIAVNGGHVARAMDFYEAEGKYFIIGGTEPWTRELNGEIIIDDSTPVAPQVTDFKLNGVVGLKKVDNISFVIPTDETTNVIEYRNQNWKRIVAKVETTLTADINAGATEISVASVEGLSVGSKLRLNGIYEAKITKIAGLVLTLDTPAPENIATGSIVLGGAIAEGSKYVYVDCYLNYTDFPIATYRQIGLCTGVQPDDIEVLVPVAGGGFNDVYTSIGNLEILDNRLPSLRDNDQRELLSLIIEF